MQLLPGASILAHCVFSINIGSVVLCIAISTAKVFFLPAFLIVTVLALLVFPTAVLFPNDNECGRITRVCSTGVGVAVGVAVMVGVAVGVAVEVAVAVAVPVVVGVAVGVADAVAV